MSRIKPITASLLSLLVLAGCGSTSDKSDPTTLNVILYDAGWGHEWFDDVIAKWEADNPGYKVNLTAKYDVKTLINRHITSKNNTDDLYINTDSGWRNYAYQGYFAPLDDLLSEEVDGVTVENKINDEFQDTLKMNVEKEEHTYRLPWTSGIGGIYYNAKMFRDNNWKVPTTTKELSELVTNILENPVEVAGSDTEAVKPFVFTGDNTDYFDYGIFNWWLQKAGYDKVKEFYQYASADNFNYKTEGSAYESLYQVVKYWKSLFTDKTLSSGDTVSTYVGGSLSYTNHQAQTDFFNGKAAMMFNGDWLYNETLQYGTNENFELQLMKMPTFEGAKETDVSYVIGSDQYIAIPASSKKQDLAKSLIKTMISDWSLSNFTNKSHGFLAYKNGNTSAIDTSVSYVSSYLNVRNSIKKATTDDSKSDAFLNGYVSNAYVTSSNRPFAGLLQQSSLTVEDCFDTIYKSAQSVYQRM